MKFWEAMREYETGRNVRCKEWFPGHFMNKDRDNTSTLNKKEFWFFKDAEWEYLEGSIKTE